MMTKKLKFIITLKRKYVDLPTVHFQISRNPNKIKQPCLERRNFSDYTHVSYMKQRLGLLLDFLTFSVNLGPNVFLKAF